jgi:succinate dehydrogenase/fumarate reductase-like Fe-S protein
MSHILHPIINEPDQESVVARVTLELARSGSADGEDACMQRYILKYRRRLSIFTALREIYELYDPTLAFRNQQCGRGICGTCRMRVDLDRLSWRNKSVKSCAIPLVPGDQVVIRPAHEKRVVRDLVVNF